MASLTPNTRVFYYNNSSVSGGSVSANSYGADGSNYVYDYSITLPSGYKLNYAKIKLYNPSLSTDTGKVFDNLKSTSGNLTASNPYTHFSAWVYLNKSGDDGGSGDDPIPSEHARINITSVHCTSAKTYAGDANGPWTPLANYEIHSAAPNAYPVWFVATPEDEHPFQFWATNTSYNSTSTQFAARMPASGDMVAVAYAKHRIGFDKQSGTGGTSYVNMDSYGDNKLVLPTSVTVPTRTGYTFQGYYDTDESTGGTQYYNASGNRQVQKWPYDSDGTLYARWKEQTAQLTVSAGTGGSLASDSATSGAKQVGSSITVKASANTGYTFSKWQLSGGSSSSSTSTSFTFTMPSSATTATASFTPNVYQVTLSPGKSISGSYIYEKYATGWYSNSGATTAITKVTPPTSIGYNFNGYYTAASGGSQRITAAGALPSNTTVSSTGVTWYGQWSAIVTTVTLDKNGGEGGSDSVEIAYDTAVGSYPSITLPTRVGYNFAGYSDSEGTQYYTASGTSVRVWDKASTTATLYAQWEAKSCSVTLNKNGGSDGSNSITATYDSAMPSITIPSRTGYNFLGYYDDETAGTQYYTSAGESATNWNKDTTSAQTLYAHWEAKKTTITLNMNSGEGGTTSVTATYDSNMPSAVMPIRQGYTFQGYYDTDATTGGTQYYTSAGRSARTWNKDASTSILYARWTPVTVTVTLDKNEGSGGTSSVTATYDEYLPNITPPTRTGYEFGGYQDSSGNVYYSSAGTGVKKWNKTTNTTLTAIWIVSSWIYIYTGSQWTPVNIYKNTGSFNSSSFIYKFDGENWLPN